MTNKDFQKYLDGMDAFKKKAATNSKIVEDIMKSAGILSPKGNLRKPYRHLKEAFQIAPHKK